MSNGRTSPPKPKPHPSSSNSPDLLSSRHYTPTPASNHTAQPSHGPDHDPDVICSGSALDIQGLKRKLIADNRASKRSASAAAGFTRYPVGGSYSMPASMGLHPALLGALTHPPASQGHFLNDLHNVYPDGLSSAHSSTSFSTNTSAASSSSATPYLFGPTSGGILPSFSVPYAQPLLPDSSRMFPGTLSSTTSGSSAPASFLSSSSLLGAALSRHDTLPAQNGGSSSDDDVIEVTGK